MLKDQHDGSILKPATKPILGTREIQFYEQLETQQDYNIPKELLAEYRGTIKMTIGDRQVISKNIILMKFKYILIFCYISFAHSGKFIHNQIFKYF